MQTKHRSSVAPRPLWPIAAAALATLTAGIFLLHAQTGHAARAGHSVVSTTKTSLGRVLVNSHGHTLYSFGKDRNGKSACSGQCATFWPPLIASGRPGVAS